MNETELMNRPLFYEENGYIGISKMDGTPILLPNRYVCKRNPYCCPDFSDGIAPLSLPDGASGYIDEQGMGECISSIRQESRSSRFGINLTTWETLSGAMRL